jgi:signal transduction histidine kinase/CheY-like chemotaxis protein
MRINLSPSYFVLGILIGATLSVLVASFYFRRQLKAMAQTYRSGHRDLIRELQARSAGLLNILNAVSVATWDVDMTTGMVQRSPNHDSLYGFSMSLPQWSYTDFINGIYEGDRPRVHELIDQTMKTREEYFSAEYRVVWPDQSIHWLASRARFAYNADGSPAHIHGILMDVTDLKQAQAELSEAKERAEHANISKSRFLANISHELRTPLSAILGFGALLREPTLNEKEKSDYAKIIERNGEILVSLIDELLDLAKVEAGRIRFENTAVDLNQLLREVNDLLTFKASEKGLKLVIERDSDVPARLMTDPVRLRQIIVNLVGNAIKFSEKGLISLMIEMDDRQRQPMMRISVKDRGIGIAPEQQGRLFSPFTQGDISTTRRFGGTGLGLYLSRELARGMGGDLYLEHSSPGEGSTFTAVLPCQAAALDTVKVPIKNLSNMIPGSSLKDLRTLVVDDSRDNQVLMGKLLSREGASVAYASHGEMGAQMALAGNFDFVLMDMQMPVMDGITATRYLREQGYKGLIIAVTADAILEQIEKARQAGCDDHISKPVNFPQLIEKLQRLKKESPTRFSQPKISEYNEQI